MLATSTNMIFTSVIKSSPVILARRIDRAYIVSCTSSRPSDFKVAAKVSNDAASANPSVKPKVADGVSLCIEAASAREQAVAEAAGDWQTLLDAGAQPLPSGCGPCAGLLEPGEVGISSSNRNSPGSMGARTAQAYLASAEVVAASALRGTIFRPDGFKEPAD
ncbi:hypothetical protein O1611_g7871 [Lasiodiplodia mahajangana]|uniref:Uncharacterized protein n=1 Tax=Lasiodiplodia mahajangana TaxID=1108764 RepID=A0ACC2JEW7_9PEZI|nr:hypothetical protein O1611_g7871 [Lasiodiplodia mahajangana]